MFGKKGQSTLEYVIVLTAIIAVIIAFAAGALRTNLRTSVEHVGTQMQGAVQKITVGD